MNHADLAQTDSLVGDVLHAPQVDVLDALAAQTRVHFDGLVRNVVPSGRHMGTPQCHHIVHTVCGVGAASQQHRARELERTVL